MLHKFYRDTELGLTILPRFELALVGISTNILSQPFDNILPSFRYLENQKVEWLSDSLPLLEETLDTRVLNIMHCWPEMARSARVLQYWLICTYKEGWSSNHISILQWSYIYISRATVRSTYQVQETFTIEMCLKGFQTLTSGDLTWPPWKTLGIIYPPRAINILSLKFRQLSLTEILCLQGFLSFNYGDLKWPLTSMENNGIIYPPRATNIPSLKFRQLSLLEISCLQGFQSLTSGDLKWLLTTMENNRDHLRTKGYQHTKFEVQTTFTCWDTVFTRFPVFDLWWPQMTFDLHGKQ